MSGTIKGYALTKSLFEVGMRFGVWCRWRNVYTGFFPVERMAESWISDNAYPEHAEIHDFIDESSEVKCKQYKALIKSDSPPKTRRQNSYSQRYYEKVISKIK